MEKRIFTVLFIASLASMLGIGIIEPFMGIYAESLGANGFYIGLIFGSFTLARAFITPLTGRLSDFRGRKIIIVWGLVGYTIMSFFYVFANDIKSLVVVRILHGAASAMVMPIAMAYIGDISPKKQEGKYLGTYTISFFLGMALGPVIGGGLHDLVSQNAAFYAMGAISFASLLLVFFMLPEINAHRNTVPATWKIIFRSKTMQSMFIFRALIAYGVAALMGFLPLLAEKLNVSIFQIGFVVSANLLFSAGFQRYFGKVADRHDKVKMILIGASIMATALGLMPLATGFYTLLLFNILMGFGSSISIPAGSAITAMLGKKMGMGTVIGVFNTAFSIGGGFGPIFAGTMMVILGLSFVFYSSAVIVMIGTTGLYFMMKNNKEYIELHK